MIQEECALDWMESCVQEQGSAKEPLRSGNPASGTYNAVVANEMTIKEAYLWHCQSVIKEEQR